MEDPVFTFGLIADVQYADIEDGENYLRTRRRYYRGSADLLRDAVLQWRRERVQCVVQLGDIIDGHNRRRDASDRALDTVMAELDACSVDVHHVWGNHEFYNFSRPSLLSSRLNSAQRTGTDTGSDLIGDDIYAYEFSPAPNFRFVLLDAYDLSVIGREEESEKHTHSWRILTQHNHNLQDLNQPPGTHTHTHAHTHTHSWRILTQHNHNLQDLNQPPGTHTHTHTHTHSWRILTQHNHNLQDLNQPPGTHTHTHTHSWRILTQHNHNLQDLNQPPVSVGLEQRFVKFNGGFSEQQLQWLDAVLTLSDHKQERVLIFSHLPVHPCAADPICLAWNHEAVLSVLRSHQSVLCFIAGHDHDGGRCTDSSGAQHITLEGVIETPPHSHAFATAYLYEDRMVMKGRGRVEDLTITYS
ncbi:manganese-dependent ADP-ribose/CDP-alcohol diphosphatase isoform X1 [Danio rerio]|uniref:Manganese-dependent ADP-ribose/CDP-alcohol diphosphatase isoform X1 n=2 Tax=Danio rerio TaxID=7955 RepID=A0AC58GV20_DANRE